MGVPQLHTLSKVSVAIAARVPGRLAGVLYKRWRLALAVGVTAAAALPVITSWRQHGFTLAAAVDAISAAWDWVSLVRLISAVALGVAALHFGTTHSQAATLLYLVIL